ncbi:MAG: porin family protein, partial [Alphaproteobacteria bacterium]|nr:porin family protein [Alphaproteobacteria bacterium]
GRGSDPSADGWFGGVHVGYNWQLGNGVVIGLEADINGGDLRSSLTGTRTVAGGPLTDANNRHSAELKWFGSARARLGYSLGHLMPYVTGGLAFGEARYVFRHVGDTARLSDTSVGWTVGAGLEYMITPNWTARAEYRYTDYGSASGARFPNFPNERQTGEFKTHDVRIGISYKFGGASARPVVARY